MKIAISGLLLPLLLLSGIIINNSAIKVDCTKVFFNVIKF